ncbi:MAG: hypothetical protein FWE33_06130 [Defluviitaleaceae bacterium]|nr:hypothetical protein [Defluviitaleaceae bacterium]
MKKFTIIMVAIAVLLLIAAALIHFLVLAPSEEGSSATAIETNILAS